MPQIEFVNPDPYPGQDEELTTGPRREWSPRVKRSVRVGAGAVLAGVAAAVLIGALRDGGGGSPTASETFSGARVLAPEAPSGAFRVDHLGADAPEGARPGTLAGQTTPATPSLSISVSTIAIPDCPRAHTCTVYVTVPDAVVAALTHALPGATAVSGGSTLTRGAHPVVQTREIAARAGRLNVRISIGPAGAAHPHSTSSTVGAGTTLSATAVERGLAIRVTVSGPDSQAPGLATVRALAADRRLLTVA